MDQLTPSATAASNAFAANIAGGVREAMTSGGITHRELSEKTGIPVSTLWPATSKPVLRRVARSAARAAA